MLIFCGKICDGSERMLPGIGVNAIKAADQALKNNLPAVGEALASAGADFGKNFGVGALTLIGAGATKTAAVAKAAAIAVVTAPATPYIVGGIVVIYVGHKTYRYYNPTPEQLELIMTAQKTSALKKCLEENQTGPRAASGIPCACQDKACSLSLEAGRESVDKIVENFVAHAPEMPGPTLWERASGVCSSVVNSSAASAVHSAITIPYDYTIGALANRSGLSSAVANIEFIKKDSCYSATIGNSTLVAGKYALAVGAAYCVYRGAKAAYNYATKP